MITDKLASIKKRIQDYGFKRLLLAVSGGLDSICLAHYFIENREALGIEWLGIAHVHHGLREGTADRDAAFVEAFAKSHGIPFFLKKLDGEALKAAEGSLEENARDARYKALVEIANEVERSFDYALTGYAQDDTLSRLSSVGASEPFSHLIIVTAHHAGDQAETMYMRLRRGTTLAGLRGIEPLRPFCQKSFDYAQDDKNVNQSPTPFVSRLQAKRSLVVLYRPLLNTTRAELIAYAKENNLKWCEDESNTDVKFARNKVRHEYLPKLEQSNHKAAQQLCRTAELANRAYKKVMKKCDELFSAALCKETLRQTQGDTDYKKITACAEMTNKEAELHLDKKALRKVLLAHADTDLSEMFRLWLSEQGLRFPIGFFFDQKEPAHVKIPHRCAYRKRSIVKKGPTIQICEFESVETALKFVSCDRTKKRIL